MVIDQRHATWLKFNCVIVLVNLVQVVHFLQNLVTSFSPAGFLRVISLMPYSRYLAFRAGGIVGEISDFCGWQGNSDGYQIFVDTEQIIYIIYLFALGLELTFNE